MWIHILMFLYIFFFIACSLLNSKEENGKKLINIRRWYKLIESQASVSAVMKDLPADVKLTTATATASAAPNAKVEGKFVDLPDAEEGKVVVRFPPEASG